MELDMECGLLETDIGNGSYNYASKRGDYDARKLVFKPMDNMNLKFSKPLCELERCQERCRCQDCHKKSVIYCSNCMMSLPCTTNILPLVSLPFNVHIIKDKREHNSKVTSNHLIWAPSLCRISIYGNKNYGVCHVYVVVDHLTLQNLTVYITFQSTAIHAKVLAKKDVQIFSIEDIPTYGEEAYLVFPDENAHPIEEVFNLEKLPLLKDPHKLKQMTIVFVDGTWKQAKSLVKNSHLRSLPKIRVEGKQTLYWRHQTGKSDTNLATIEVCMTFF